MRKYFIPIIPLHDILSHIKRYVLYIFLSKVLPFFFFGFRDHEGNASIIKPRQMNCEEIVEIIEVFFFKKRSNA